MSANSDSLIHGCVIIRFGRVVPQMAWLDATYGRAIDVFAADADTDEAAGKHIKTYLGRT
jgi:hypothetical protein